MKKAKYKKATIFKFRLNPSFMSGVSGPKILVIKEITKKVSMMSATM